MPPIVLDGTTGITTPGLTNTGTETLVNLTTTGNTILGDASTDTLNVGNGGLVKDASGNVGIGTTTTSAYRLNVKAAFTSGVAGAYIEAGEFNQSVMVLNHTNASVSSNLFQVQKSGTGVLTLDASGNLLVGGTSSLSSSAGRTDFTLNGSSSGGIISFGTGGVRKGYLYQDSSDFNIANEVAGNIRFLNNGSERARIDSSGNFRVGVGTSTINTYMDVNHATGSSNGASFFVARYNGTQIGDISQATTSTVAYNTSSDYRLKENIQPMTGALAKVALLKPCIYTWKVDGAAGQGFIAHELQEVVPDCVTGAKDAIETYIDDEGNEQTRPKYQGIDTSFLVATLTAAIQEQQAIIQSLTDRITALENK